MRPPEPVPFTLLRSRLFSLAILRTSGEERTPSMLTDSSASTGSSCLAATGCGAGAAAGAALLGAAAGAAPAEADPPITATTVLIWTVVPSGTLISVSVPAMGEGISASTLSVEISNSGSSCATVSPTFLSHLVIVPSKMDSPICGMMTSVVLPAAGAAGFADSEVGVASAFGGAESPSACGDGATGAGAAAAAPSSDSTATTVLICTVVPSPTLISVSVPAAGDGISASTLSVEISNSGSSRCTASPGFFSHLVMVPSKIDSPIWGMITSVGMISFPVLSKDSQQNDTSHPASRPQPGNLERYRFGNPSVYARTESSCPLSRFNSFGMLRGVSWGIICGGSPG